MEGSEVETKGGRVARSGTAQRKSRLSCRAAGALGGRVGLGRTWDRKTALQGTRNNTSKPGDSAIKEIGVDRRN